MKQANVNLVYLIGFVGLLAVASSSKAKVPAVRPGPKALPVHPNLQARVAHLKSAKQWALIRSALDGRVLLFFAPSGVYHVMYWSPDSNGIVDLKTRNAALRKFNDIVRQGGDYRGIRAPR